MWSRLNIMRSLDNRFVMDIGSSVGWLNPLLYAPKRIVVGILKKNVSDVKLRLNLVDLISGQSCSPPEKINYKGRTLGLL